MVGAGLKVQALIGSTMAECTPDFAGELGADAIGVFASDRPTGGFQPSALDATARAIYDRLATAWAKDNPVAAPSDEYGMADPDASASAGPVIVGPIESRRRRPGRPRRRCRASRPPGPCSTTSCRRRPQRAGG